MVKDDLIDFIIDEVAKAKGNSDYLVQYSAIERKIDEYTKELQKDNDRMVKQINKMSEDMYVLNQDLNKYRSSHEAIRKHLFK